MKKINRNKLFVIVLIVGFSLIGLFFLYDYIKKEKDNYKLYNDFTRANQVMTLSFNKNFLLQFDTIRSIQSSNFDIKISPGGLIYDFANYKIVPILNFMNRKVEDEYLKEAFLIFSEFIANFNTAKMGDRENILVKQSNGDYFKKEDNIYKYVVKKEVISKNEFNKLYDNYLQSIGISDTINNFVKNLIEVDSINSKYNYNQLLKIINNNYVEFYSNYESEIISIIAKDLIEFCNYLNEDYLEIDQSGEVPPKIIKNIDTETIILNYNFTLLDRVFVPYSKYYLYSYQLDLENVWLQLELLGYPKLYM